MGREFIAIKGSNEVKISVNIRVLWALGVN